jgi:hypothetical protein
VYIDCALIDLPGEQEADRTFVLSDVEEGAAAVRALQQGLGFLELVPRPRARSVQVVALAQKV